MKRIVLVSQSPRRQAILRNLGFRPECATSRFEEPPVRQHADPPRLARELAEAKMAQAICPAGGELLVTADTLVFLGRRIFGKPADEGEARAMLESLSGRTHAVATALCLRDPGQNRQLTEAAVTRVTFESITAPVLDLYLATGEWRDKAGAYGIQGWAALFTRKIEGCYFNVVGFPVNLFGRLLQQLGYGPRDFAMAAVPDRT